MDDLISRRAAIDALHTYFEEGFEQDRWWNSTHVLKAIRGVPSAQRESAKDTNVPINDCISRQAAIDAFDGAKVDEEYCDEYDIGYNDGINFAISKLSVLPSAQRKGKWIATQEWGGRNYSCSCCKFSFMVDTCMLEPLWNYCPNCGAEMVKGEEDV